MKSIMNEVKQIQTASNLIGYGARLQVLVSETDLSYERLLRLYREVAGRSPSKGQLPFSTDWFLKWQPNIHASLFLNIYEYLSKAAAIESVDALMKAFGLYQEQMDSHDLEPILTITRAWRLVKFVDNQMLCLCRCSQCHGRFLAETYENPRQFVCGLCRPPARAGKSQQTGRIFLH